MLSVKASLPVDEGPIDKALGLLQHDTSFLNRRPTTAFMFQLD